MSSRSRLIIWLGAARLRTLPLALATIILGSLLAKASGNFSWNILIWCVITAICYQVLSNFANDLGDGLKGTDANRTGEKRAVASGFVSISQMKSAVALFTVLSFFSGTYLSVIATSGWVSVFFITLGAFATWAALSYTMGKRAYGYSGWGDVFVVLFFGWVGVLGSYFLQAGLITADLFMPATSVGFLAAGVLNLNNMRDIENDRNAGKKTLVVKLGLNQAKLYHVALLSSATLLQAGFVVYHDGKWSNYLVFITVPLLVNNMLRAWKAKGSADFEPLLKPLALTTLLFCLLAGIGFNL